MVRLGHANAVQSRERAGSAKPGPITKNGGKNFNEKIGNVRANGQN